MLKGNDKVTQTPLLWQLCPPKKLFRKAANNAIIHSFSVEADSEWRDSKKPTLQTSVHSPSLGLMFCCMFEHLSECSEDTEVGLESPKSSGPSAAAVDEYKRVHARITEGSAVRLFSLESSSSSD